MFATAGKEGSRTEEKSAGEEEMMLEIFAYTERVVNMVRPRRMLIMAIGAYARLVGSRTCGGPRLTLVADGVAPRAKMNQQRSRRFRTAKEAKEVREKAERKGEKLPDTKAFDSNCITPGASSIRMLCVEEEQAVLTRGRVRAYAMDRHGVHGAALGAVAVLCEQEDIGGCELAGRHGGAVGTRRPR